MSTEKTPETKSDPNTVIKNREFAREFASFEIPAQETAKVAREWGQFAVSDFALKGMHVGNEAFTPLVDHIELDNVNKDEFNIANRKLGYSKIQISQLWNNLGITDSGSRTGIHFGSRLKDGSFDDDGHYHVLDVSSLAAFVQGLPRKNIRYVEEGHEHRLRPRNLFGKKELEMITRFVDNYGSLPEPEKEPKTTFDVGDEVSSAEQNHGNPMIIWTMNAPGKGFEVINTKINPDGSVTYQGTGTAYPSQIDQLPREVERFHTHEELVRMLAIANSLGGKEPAEELLAKAHQAIYGQ